MQSPVVGAIFVFIFTAASAVRDVYFAGVFQALDIFDVILLAFSLGTVVFATVAAIRAPGDFRKLGRDLAAVAWMNATTALAWCSYFFALKHLEPSIVNTMFSGAGPLTLFGLAAVGIHVARPSPVGAGERLCYAGIVVAFLALGWVVVSGRSGLPTPAPALGLAGLALAVLSGASISVSVLFSKRLHEAGIGADAVLATRFVTIVVVAAMVKLFGDVPFGVTGTASLATLSAAALVLIVLPNYAFQLGIARTTPLTAGTIAALGPVLLFALQAFDGRTAYSGYTLGCILLYATFAIAGNLARARVALSAPPAS